MAVTRHDGRAAAVLRWGGTLVAVGALVTLGVITPPGTARASNPVTPAGGGGGYDQLTGIGGTASQVIIPWTAGLRDNTNQPISGDTNGELNPNSDRSSDPGSAQPKSEVAFMDSDFAGLTVTVSQTENIGHGGITVTWTWDNSQGQPQGTIRSSGIQADYLQMMECYGDSSLGPSPEGCEFGAPGITGANSGAGNNPTVAVPTEQRQGRLCAVPIVEVPTGVAGQDGSNAAAGCDPFEPGQGPSQPTDQPHVDPCPQGGCTTGQYSIPFVPVDPTLGNPAYNDNDIAQYFNAFNTNEVMAATTAPNGTGEQQFETDTFVQAPALGCGEQEADGSTRDCWLIIVPRGTFEPNGYQLQGLSNAVTALNQANSSAISAANWAQRIQVHLSYAPLPQFCPVGGQIDSPELEGTPLVTRAVQSWESTLDQQSQCTRIYHQTEVSEQQVTNDFIQPASFDTNGLAFTTNPIGSDRNRQGTPLPQLPNIVYAPIAIAGTGFAFHVDEFDALPPSGTNYTFGYLAQPVKLTPQLLARAVTQVYRYDLPDYAPEATPPQLGGSFAQNNPTNITFDPVFQQLNPEVAPYGAGGAIPAAPFDTIDHSGLYQQIWNWVQGDSANVSWLDGAKTNSGVAADPDYASLGIGSNPNFDSMPRAYRSNSCPVLGTPAGPETRCSTDSIPYVASFDAASAAVLSANPLTYSSNWNPSNTSPSGTPGFWDKNSIEPPGRIFIWAVDDTPSMAAFGIVPAALCADSDTSGTNCVSPSVASVSAAVANAKPDSAGLLEVNPANPGAGAYPLTSIIYAAVRTDEAAQLLNDYADFISFAVNKGQTEGQAAGDLPAGYLPLPPSLVTQANAAVTTLRQIAGGQPTSSPSPSASASASPSPASGGPTTAAPAGSNPQSSTPASNAPAATANAAAYSSVGTSASATSAAAPGSTPTGPVIVPPGAQLVAGTTKGQPVGPIRDVVVYVFVIGLVGAGGGVLLRSGRLPRWPGRPRP
jgi:hypothetical protein